MAEYDHHSLEDIVQSETVLGIGVPNEAATDDLEDEPYPASLDQYKRIKAREETDEPPPQNATGQMLIDRGDPKNLNHFDKSNPFSRILNVLVQEGGSAPVPIVMAEARVTVFDVKNSLIPNVVGYDPVSVSVRSIPVEEQVAARLAEGETQPLVEPIQALLQPKQPQVDPLPLAPGVEYYLPQSYFVAD